MLRYVVHCKWESYCLSTDISIRYMTMYDAFLPAASQAMVRFRFFIHHKKNSMLVWWFPQDTSPSWLECPATHDTLVKVRGKKRTGFVLAVYSKATTPPPWAALKFLPPNTNPPIPWHRVISASGTISSRGPGTTGAQRQRDALQAEGVQVTTGRTGEMRVNLSEFGLFPSITDLNLQDAHRRDDDDGSETWYIYIIQHLFSGILNCYPSSVALPPLGFPNVSAAYHSCKMKQRLISTWLDINLFLYCRERTSFQPFHSQDSWQRGRAFFLAFKTAWLSPTHPACGLWSTKCQTQNVIVVLHILIARSTWSFRLK